MAITAILLNLSRNLFIVSTKLILSPVTLSATQSGEAILIPPKLEHVSALKRLLAVRGLLEVRQPTPG
jgi:hypothetical protein